MQIAYRLGRLRSLAGLRPRRADRASYGASDFHFVESSHLLGRPPDDDRVDLAHRRWYRARHGNGVVRECL